MACCVLIGYLIGLVVRPIRALLGGQKGLVTMPDPVTVDAPQASSLQRVS